jgi:CRP-like cAMP-binding protein
LTLLPQQPEDLRIRLKPGTVLIREGELGEEFYLLEKGMVNISVKGRQIAKIHAVDGQEFVGEIASLLGVARTATVTAATECVLLKVPRVNLENVLKNSPSLGLKLIRSLCRKLAMTTQVHAQTQAQNATIDKSGSTELSVRNYMKGVLFMVEELTANPTPESASAVAEYIKASNPWKLQHGDSTMIQAGVPSFAHVTPEEISPQPEAPAQESTAPTPPPETNQPPPTEQSPIG